MPMDPIDAARKEILVKTLQQIQVETAFTWAYRACAAKRLSAEAKKLGNPVEAMKWLIDAEEYAHESVEHGALAGDSVLADVRKVLSAC